MYHFTIKRLIHVPKQVAWKVISDLDAYADYAPNLSFSKVVAGDGVGLVRQCTDTNGGQWQEQCVLWDEGRTYSIQVDTSDYPYPFSYVQGTWGVEAIGNYCAVMMQFDLQPKFDPPLIGGLVYKWTFQPAFKRISEKLMDNWEAAMLNRTEFSIL